MLYPPQDASEANVRTAIESALKRASPGFLKVVGLWTPTLQPTQDVFGQYQEPLSSWEQLQGYLAQEYQVQQVTLSTGSVPADVDVLVVVAPQGMTDTERYAVDQYLMGESDLPR